MWLLLAFGSALFAGLTSVLAKCGIKRTDSHVATAVRTVVVLVFAWLMVFLTGAQGGLGQLRGRNLLFLALSGLATGASWLCYFRALQLGDVSKVVPVDKSSTVLTILLAILLLGETDKLEVKLPCAALIALGTYLMLDWKRAAAGQAQGRRWFWYALGSAVFAALTSILAKIGIHGVDSNLATAIRTGVVLVMAWALVFVTGKQGEARGIGRRELGFICLSGLATGASWLCYFQALQLGPASIVVPIDKLSILVTILFARLVYKEKLTPPARVGLALITLGTLAMAVWGR